MDIDNTIQLNPEDDEQPEVKTDSPLTTTDTVDRQSGSIEDGEADSMGLPSFDLNSLNLKVPESFKESVSTIVSAVKSRKLNMPKFNKLIDLSGVDSLETSEENSVVVNSFFTAFLLQNFTALIFFKIQVPSFQSAITQMPYASHFSLMGLILGYVCLALYMGVSAYFTLRPPATLTRYHLNLINFLMGIPLGYSCRFSGFTLVLTCTQVCVLLTL